MSQDGFRANYTIEDHHTLEHVGVLVAEFLRLTPARTEQFLADWFDQWAPDFTYAHTIGQVEATGRGRVWDRLCSMLGRYTKYQSDQQLADFVLTNLFRITNQNVLSSLRTLAERSCDEDAHRLLAARAHIEALADGGLGELLHRLARTS